MGYYSSKKATDPKWIAGDEEHDEALAASGVGVEAASRIQPQPIRWLVENIIPYEAVTVIAGEPGSGKTFFGCQLAADAARVSQLRVVAAVSGNESPKLFRWRLDQADGDTRRIALADLTPKGFNDHRARPTEESVDERMSILYYTLLGAGDPKSGILPADINAEQDATALAPAISPREKEHHQTFPDLPGAAELLIIDDIDGWFGEPGNLLPAAALARVIERLNELARTLHVAIVVLVRTQSNVNGRTTSRQLSRLAQAASVVWMITKDRDQGSVGGRCSPAEAARVLDLRSSVLDASGDNVQSEDLRPKTEDPSPDAGGVSEGLQKAEQPRRAYSQSVRRWFLPVKNNLAPDAATYGRSFEILDAQIRWHADDPAPSLADALLPNAHNSDRRRLRHAAMLWIERALADGPLPSKEFFQLGFDSGHSKGTLVRAAGELGIHSQKTGFNGGWEMRWVPQPVVEGRGTTARMAGAGFRIVGGEAAKAEGKGQKAETTGDVCVASCASSQECGENGAVSCASSQECGENGAVSCASSQECGENGTVSCASSTECKDSREASCASSTPPPRGDKRVTLHALVIDALQEACLKEAG